MRKYFVLLVAVYAFVLGGCKSGGNSLITSPPNAPAGFMSVNRDVQINWPAAKESLVNMAGGGYRVYASLNPNFDLTGPGTNSPINVAFNPTSGSTPTTATLTLPSATWYIKIVAVMTLPNGDVIESPPSGETTIVVPFAPEP